MQDNGWFLGEHAMTSKVLPYEESMRVPMMVSGPGVPHLVLSQLVLNIDLPATILDLAGMAVGLGRLRRGIASQPRQPWLRYPARTPGFPSL
ncbi:MAG: hypothetical protein H7A46_00240 [Verrucomicrobiales bacterium]|nr:hypothetical protein [Verrucomicrobiales bacterium]